MKELWRKIPPEIREKIVAMLLGLIVMALTQLLTYLQTIDIKTLVAGSSTFLAYSNWKSKQS